MINLIIEFESEFKNIIYKSIYSVAKLPKGMTKYEDLVYGQQEFENRSLTDKVFLMFLW